MPLTQRAAVSILALLSLSSCADNSVERSKPNKRAAAQVECSQLMETTSQAFMLLDEQVARKSRLTVSQSQKQCRQTDPGQQDAALKALDLLKPAGMPCEKGEPIKMGNRVNMASMRCTAQDGVLSISAGYDSATGELLIVTTGMSRR